MKKQLSEEIATRKRSLNYYSLAMFEVGDIDLGLAQRDKILSETGVKFTKDYFIKNYGLE